MTFNLFGFFYAQMEKKMELCNPCRLKNKAILGRTVYIPLGRKVTNPDLVKKLREQGKTIKQIASHFDICDRRVFQILKNRSN
jgi:hypothetical protein